MNKNVLSMWQSVSPAIVIIVSVCLAGMFYWSMPVSEIEKSSPLAWFAMAFLAGIVAGTITDRDFSFTGLLVITGFALAIIIRIIYDISFVDKTSHNLFPIEVVMWTIMAAIPAFAGTLIANRVIRPLAKKLKSSEKE